MALVYGFFGGIIKMATCLPILLWSLLAITFFPVVMALPEQGNFPEMSFKAFASFVDLNFNSKISLSTVLLLLFTMTDNPDLLSLHFRQQHPTCSGENNTKLSAWIKSLARELCVRLGDKKTDMLFKSEDRSDNISGVATKLNDFAKVLGLTPYNRHDKYIGKLKPISHDEISPVLVICPNSMNCEDMNCEPRAILQITEDRDVPYVKLIKGTTIHEKVIVLGGKCTKCLTIYQADHERVIEKDNPTTRIYVNSAKYLKIGQNTWGDRTFSSAIVNGMYSFHASASAYTEFWNNSYGINGKHMTKITRRQVWQAFIQESIRTIGYESKINLQIQNGLSISEKTELAFEALGNNGRIDIANGHSCSECTQPYKYISDLRENIDPAAMLGLDEDRNVPSLNEDNIPELDDIQLLPAQPQIVNDLNIQGEPVKMVVLDGIVMGPTVCYYILNFIN